MEALKDVELTSTNRPCGLTIAFSIRLLTEYRLDSVRAIRFGVVYRYAESVPRAGIAPQALDHFYEDPTFSLSEILSRATSAQGFRSPWRR